MNRSDRKMHDWRRRPRPAEAYEPLAPLMHRCNRCTYRNQTGIVCPDCLLNRAMMFLDVYGVTPDTRPYSIPRSQIQRQLSPVRTVRLPGYPDSNRFGRRPL